MKKVLLALPGKRKLISHSPIITGSKYGCKMKQRQLSSFIIGEEIVFVSNKEPFIDTMEEKTFTTGLYFSRP